MVDKIEAAMEASGEGKRGHQKRFNFYAIWAAATCRNPEWLN